MHCHRPDGLIAGAVGRRQRRLRRAARAGRAAARPARPALGRDRGAAGTAPRTPRRQLPDGGYFTSSAAAGATARRRYADERYLIFDCGPLGDGGHGHYDLLSVEIAAGGRPLVVDPAATPTPSGADLRRWFKGTAAHNTVCVDGLDQTPYRRGQAEGPVAARPPVERLTAPRAGRARGEARARATTPSTAPRSSFVAGEYWLIEDRLRRRPPHRYDLRFHLAPEGVGAGLRCSAATPCLRRPRAWGVALVRPRRRRRPVIEPGWIAPDYGIKHLRPGRVRSSPTASRTRRSPRSSSRSPTAPPPRTPRCGRDAGRHDRRGRPATASPTRCAGRTPACRSTSARCAAASSAGWMRVGPSGPWSVAGRPGVGSGPRGVGGLGRRAAG